jgi:glycosyltransferase involved in cell wall biosynthesis
VKRIAVVVQRCHPEALGGSEALAWHYASLLCERYDVDILTSCATDYVTWENTLPSGEERREGITLRRFPVAFPRGRHFTALHRRMLADHAASGSLSNWSEALAEEFIRFQGPWCPQLNAHLVEHGEEYAAVIACTYLYPTSYFALDAVAPAKRILVPTLHDEPPAYLPAFANLARRCSTLWWLTQAERQLGGRLWNVDHGEVIGMAIDEEAAAEPERRERAYFLYCGRIDESKGLRDLLAAFDLLRRQGPRDVELVLTGSDHLGLPERREIVFLGHVPAARKRALMAGCAAFVMPSAHESFSIVTLEAMAQGAWVIANADSAVLADHVARSGSGEIFRGTTQCAQHMQAALRRDDSTRACSARLACRYVSENYSRDRVARSLSAALNKVLQVNPGR